MLQGTREIIDTGVLVGVVEGKDEVRAWCISVIQSMRERGLTEREIATHFENPTSTFTILSY